MSLQWRVFACRFETDFCVDPSPLRADSGNDFRFAPSFRTFRSGQRSARSGPASKIAMQQHRQAGNTVHGRIQRERLLGAQGTGETSPTQRAVSLLEWLPA